MSGFISFAETKKFNELMESFTVVPFKEVDKILQEAADRTKADLRKNEAKKIL